MNPVGRDGDGADGRRRTLGPPSAAAVAASCCCRCRQRREEGGRRCRRHRRRGRLRSKKKGGRVEGKDPLLVSRRWEEAGGRRGCHLWLTAAAVAAVAAGPGWPW
eukprot:CAMPEP_0178568370 /NCGR_PEP_ID=MMETSP0697-20121206/15864_1 /TAXON_ID=265572 /ORGANISM="Extubocellulus spinifer, Strain CCMP396" /LENGTH=104 /DNA_ID=CAMNT_0020202449 /DNA_START=339 /DNA_END=650 /DNA_ORIENTATION=-